MASRTAVAFGGLRSIPFAFYRSGTSRGIYVLERDVPPKGPDRDAVLCKLMGSGHPQQLEGFGGGIGPTSKAVVVGAHPEADSVTYTFAQCKVEDAVVDHSHGDCGNMLAAVGPFALERGLVKVPQQFNKKVAFAPFKSDCHPHLHNSSGPRPRRFMSNEFPQIHYPEKARVRIHSLNTGSVSAADVRLSQSDAGCAVCYSGDAVLPGIPSPAAPVVLTTFGIAGSQTGKLLPTGRAVDWFHLGNGLGEVAVSVVDFARVLVMFDANEVLPKFGYESWADATKDRIEADTRLNAALNHVRCAVSTAIGMGDGVGKDAPKVALLAPFVDHSEHRGSESHAVLGCRYFVNPERCEMHPTLAMTAAQAIGAACLLEGSVARAALNCCPAADEDDPTAFSFRIAHPEGMFPVTIGTGAAANSDDEAFEKIFPRGLPNSGKYCTTVLPLADGRAFL